MKALISLLCSVLFISTFIEPSYSQNSTGIQDFTYSGTLKIYPNEQCMVKKQTDNRLILNSPSNESTEDGLYYVYFVYSSNFGIVKKGDYKVRVLKHIGSRMKESYFDVKVELDKPRFYEILALKKGVYSLRIYDENDVLLGSSGYFNVTSDPSLEVQEVENSSAQK